MYDAIVVGARCAGSPTAMLLARKGHRVLLVDRATFPSDTISTHFIWQSGVACLKRWGLLEKVQASNCPAIPHISLDFGPVALTGVPPAADGVTEGYGPRRTVLDKILVDAAVAAGVELREGFSVTELVVDGERVTGIRGHAAGASTVTETARIVVGADGRNSLVARAVQAAEYQTLPALECSYYTYWSGVPREGLELYLRGEQRRWMGVVPTNDGMICLFIAWPIKEFHTYRADIEGNYLKTLDLVPDLAERVRNGRREARFMGTADVPNFFRNPYGPGWALVGDAGYHKDPTTGEGISDAFRDAELLANAIDEGLAGKRTLSDALADYERQRNQTVMPIYEMTCQLATYEPPPPEQMRLFAALQGNQQETDRLLGTLAGTVSIPEFFAPENVQRILGGRQEVTV